MKRSLNILLLIILLVSLIVPAMALTGNETIITFDNLHAVTDSDLEIHGLNATTGQYELMGIWNTSSPDITFTPGTYTILVKTHAVSTFTDLPTFAHNVLNYFETNATVFAVMLALIGAFIVITRRR
jgi:hypothetical protein